MAGGGLNPWRRIRALNGWELRWHRGGDLGWTDFEDKVISLSSELLWAERRSTAMHEALHAERGPVLEGVLAEREELAVRRLAARLLLPSVREIGEALAWAHSAEEAAEELDVDVEVLRDRLRWLHPAERHYLRARLEARLERAS